MDARDSRIKALNSSLSDFIIGFGRVIACGAHCPAKDMVYMLD